jgi:hypothetical protein
VSAAAFPLRAVVLDALTDAYWYRRGQTEGCPDCRRSPGKICLLHQEDDARAQSYLDTARELKAL